MNEEYRKHLREHFDAIHELQKTIAREKEKVFPLVKGYLDSLKSFPQWLTIFSGFLAFFGEVNRCFLIIAFACFISSALLILCIERSAAMSTMSYANMLNGVANLTSDFSYKITLHTRGELTDEVMKEEERKFDSSYPSLRASVKVDQDEKKTNALLEKAFWLSVIGAVFMVLSLF